MKRRHFLQVAGSTLATLGFSQGRLQWQAQRYGQVLAQDTRRKLALLVGVNRYPDSLRFLNLRGCATDVEMQRQLLIHRFRFQPQDICVLSQQTELAPTRKNILTAFEQHLIQQAKPGDVVVFHFSGHGSRVLDPDPIHADDLNSTLVPADVAGDVEAVDDIMGRTLFLLMSALKTEQVTVVLDSCYSGGGTRGNVRIRAAAGGRAFKPSERELQYQERWLETLVAERGLNRAEFLAQRDLGVAKGAVIAAAQRDEAAADVTFDGFDAGAFTYLLTQFLWQQADSIRGTVARIRSDVQAISDQLPLHDVPANSGAAEKPVYFVEESAQVPAAEAVVTAMEGSEATVWLGGVHPDAIATYTRGTLLTPADRELPLSIRERHGLLATVEAPQPLSPAMPLREAARIVPGDISLAIGIDPSLAPDLASIQAHLNQLPYTTAIPPQADGTYGSAIHYILSAMTPAHRQGLSPRSRPPALDTIGLFSQDLRRWIPNSFSQPGDSIRAALLTLTPRFRALLAVQMVTLSLNAQASRLAIAADLSQRPDRQVIASARTGTVAATTIATAPPSQTTTRHTPLQLQVTNLDQMPLYIGVLGIFPSADLTLLYPQNPDRTPQLQPGSTTIVPNPSTQVDLVIATAGFYEIVVLASPSPFNHALKSLKAIRSGDRLPDQTSPNLDLSGFNGLFTSLDSRRSDPQAQTTQTLTTHDLVALSLPFDVRY